MTIQNLYTQYLDGKITKQKFLYEARRDQNLDMISPSNSFDDVVKILKNKSIISEKAHKEAKLATGKQEVDIIAKTIDMVNPYEYTRGMNYELEIMDIPATEGDLSEENILKAQKKVLANLTKNSQYYGEKMHGKGEVGHEWIEATKKEIEKIGKGKSKMIREGVENGLKQMGYSDSDIEDFMDEYEQGGVKLPKKVKDYLDNLNKPTRPGYHPDGTPKSNDEMSDDEREAFYNDSDFLDEGGNLGHNEISSIHPEGAYWIVTYRGPKGTTEKSFSSEKEARKFQDSLNEHGQYADRVADVNADSSPLKERQRAIYEKYTEKTGIPMENLMAMVREAKAKKMEEAIALKDRAGNIQYAKDSTEASNIEKGAKAKGITLTKTAV
jgi:hypothetical protein